MLVTRRKKGSPLSIDELDGNFDYLENLAKQGGEVSNTETFTVAKDVKKGKVASLLLNGQVTEFDMGVYVNDGLFIDSLVLPDNRILLLYVKISSVFVDSPMGGFENEIAELYARIGTFENQFLEFGTEQSLGNSNEINFPFSPEYPLGVNLLYENKTGNILLLGFGGYSYPMSEPMIFQVIGDTVILKMFNSVNVPENFDKITSILSHPVLNRLVVAYYDDFDSVMKIAIWDVEETVDPDKGGEFEITELDSVTYDGYSSEYLQLTYHPETDSVVVIGFQEIK